MSDIKIKITLRSQPDPIPLYECAICEKTVTSADARESSNYHHGPVCELCAFQHGYSNAVWNMPCAIRHTILKLNAVVTAFACEVRNATR